MDKEDNLVEMKNTLMNVPIKDENTALNVLVSFINLAQRRGVFSIDESAKIWECINKFQKKA
jgi:glutathione synthase/RimK-type ligase-like ATP-grasp enzyme